MFFNGSISQKDPIDCLQHCHMAWIIRNNRHLLDAFVESSPPTCSDDTSFDSLDPDGFDNCPLELKHEGIYL